MERPPNLTVVIPTYQRCGLLRLALEALGRQTLSIAEYEAVRSDPRQFIVAPGHELPEIETIVARKISA